MISTIAGCIWLSMAVTSDKTDRVDEQVDQLDAGERDDDAADDVDQQVATQYARRALRAIAHPLQRERNEGDDDQCVEDDRRQNGALRCPEIHDVERRQLRAEGEAQ